MKRLLMVLLLALALIAASFPAAATVQAQEVALGETNVVVPANGTATIPFTTFCLEFGKQFPSALGRPDGRAQDEVLRVLKEGLQRGLTDSAPLQVQLAIWHEILNEWPYPDGTVDRDVAQTLVDAAQNTDLSPLRGEGVPLDQAVANGTIVARSEDFHFVEAPSARPDDYPYLGKGTLILQNTTNEAVQVYFPFGTVFRAGNENEQDIVAFATELQQLTPTPSPTPMPTNTPTPAPTNTPAPETPTPAPETPTPVPTPAQLPTTGGPNTPSNSNALPLMLAVGGFGLLGSALLLRATRRRLG